MGRPRKKPPEPAENGSAGQNNRVFPQPHEEILRIWDEQHETRALLVYLYRIWPVTDRRLSGKKWTNIQKWPNDEGLPLTLEAIEREHGNGTYDLVMVDQSDEGYKAKRARFRIASPDGFPKCDPAEVQHIVENESYFEGAKRRGIIKDEDGDMAESATGKQAIELLGKVIEKQNGQTPAKADDLERLTSLATVVKSMMPAAPDPLKLLKDMQELSGGQNALVLALLGQMREDRQASEQRFEKLLERLDKPVAAVATAEDEEVKLERQLRLYKGIARSFGPSPASADGWLDKLGPYLGPALSMLAARVMAPAAPGPSPNSPHPGASQPPPPIAAAGAPAPGPAVQNPHMEAGLSIPGVSDEDMRKLMRLIEVGNKALGAFERGVGGYDFAAAIYHGESDGEEILVALDEFGRDKIMGILSQSPQWPTLEGRREAVAAWLDDFLTFGDPDPSEPTDEKGGAA